MVATVLLGFGAHVVFAQTSLPTSPTPIYTRMSIDGGITTVRGQVNIFVRMNDIVGSVGLHKVIVGTTERQYLGRAVFSPANNLWVYSWDTTSTPDGLYKLVPLVIRLDGTTGRGEGLGVTVKNLETTTVDTTAVKIEEYKQIFQTNLNIATQEVASDIEEVVVKSVVEKTALPNTESGGFAIPFKPTPIDFNKLLTQKIPDLRNVIEGNDDKQRQQIIAEIVRSIQGTSTGVTPEATAELTEKVKDSVAKIESILLEQQKGTIDTQNFAVTAIEVAEVTTKPDGTKTASKLTFRGKALPNSFATLYIFSIPIVVTVKTDNEGNWIYALDKELEDGKHHVYVAVTDVKGQVVARSNPLSFIKQANAISLSEIQIVPTAQPAPSFTDNNYFYVIIIIILLVLVIVFIIMGVKLSRKTPDNMEVPTDTDTNQEGK